MHEQLRAANERVLREFYGEEPDEPEEIDEESRIDDETVANQPEKPNTARRRKGTRFPNLSLTR